MYVNFNCSQLWLWKELIKLCIHQGRNATYYNFVTINIVERALMIFLHSYLFTILYLYIYTYIHVYISQYIVIGSNSGYVFSIRGSGYVWRFSCIWSICRISQRTNLLYFPHRVHVPSNNRNNTSCPFLEVVDDTIIANWTLLWGKLFRRYNINSLISIVYLSYLSKSKKFKVFVSCDSTFISGSRTMLMTIIDIDKKE